MISITVKHRETGSPISGQRLSLEFCGESIGWTKMVETDLEGRASFAVAPTDGTLFVNGTRFFEGRILDGSVVFVGE